MNTTIQFAVVLCLMIIAGCAGDGKYINARGVLDNSISYTEKDTQNQKYTLTRSTDLPGGGQVVEVPQPVLVDQNSTIVINILKERITHDSANGGSTKQSDDLLNRKKVIVEALNSLTDVVHARQKALDTYRTKDLPLFFQAKKDAATVERQLIAKLRSLWPRDSKEYSLLGEAYDPPTYKKLQTFLSDQIVSIDEANKVIENDVKKHARRLTLQAFLQSPGKEPTAVHLDGYDSLKEGNLAKRDRLGLDLSEEERKRLDAHVQETQEMAATLEHLRNGEATLNDSVQQMRSMIAPEVSSLLDEGERLQSRLNTSALKARTDETKQLFNAFISMIKEKNSSLFNSKNNQLQASQDAFVAGLTPETKSFLEVVNNCVSAATTFKQDWQNATTPAAMVTLIEKTTSTVKSLQSLSGKLPEVISDVQGKAMETMEANLQDVSSSEREVLLQSNEGKALLSDLEGYYQDFKDVSKLIESAAASLFKSQVSPVAVISSVTASFQVPVEDIKDTFINLEATPRLPGDSVTVKAALKEADDTVVDTSVASFEVERYGHYADLSPAVVLIKPDQLKGGDDGFRFAPVLSWMHHWYPRPENNGKTASVFRALDPALGIHSAFTNFRSDSGSDSIQIGLGMTLSFWLNHIQFGVGYNLMAKSKDMGEIYYFVGSDLIGLLQTVGIVKR